jgi:hypothetical protein
MLNTMNTSPINNRFSFSRIISGRQFAPCAALALFLAGGLASVRADTILESGFLVGGAPLSLPGFNPANGLLTAVHLDFVANDVVGGGVYNPSAFLQPFSIPLTSSFNVSVSGTSLSAWGSGTGNASGFVPANTSCFYSVPMSGSGYAVTLLPADLAFFTSTDPVWFNLGESVSGGSPMPPLWSINPYGTGPTCGFGLTYYYTPVPEPSAVALLALGGAAGLLRRRSPC